jgi:hypothetical protein
MAPSKNSIRTSWTIGPARKPKSLGNEADWIENKIMSWNQDIFEELCGSHRKAFCQNVTK